MAERVFTRRELSTYNGLNGAAAFVACCGKVYDVSGSFHWRHGRHWMRHVAGTDLTNALEQAPHGAELLAKYPIVGVLHDD